VDPCLWNANPLALTLAAGQNAIGIAVKLAQASTLTVQVKDAQNLLKQLTRGGRRPDLSVDVWGVAGLYYSAHAASITR
jgi:hypothetical protein